MTVRRFARENSGFAGALACLAALCAAPLPALAQSCNLTDAPAALTGVVNTYYPGTGAPAAAANAVTVDTTAVRGATGTPIAAGDLLLVIQVQGADFDASNNDGYGDNVNGAPASGYLDNPNFIAGLYEYVVAAAAVGASPGAACAAAAGKLCVIGTGTGDGLLYGYSTTVSNTDQNRYQVIRVLSTATPPSPPGSRPRLGTAGRAVCSPSTSAVRRRSAGPSALTVLAFAAAGGGR
jgi:hypothetical protein